MSTIRFIVYIQCIFSIFLLSSCSDERSLEELERIKMIGDETPKKALIMLDSLKIRVREESNYVKNKYDLLQIRLNDKADNIPNSDIMIKNLIGYFEINGSMLDKQEVYYYAGSVYRDLHDTPRSLEYFLKSIEYAKNENNCDSLMMRNAYSNLNDLYYNVQNYNDAVKMAQKELEITKKMKNNTILPYLHIGTAYLAQNNQQQACVAFDAVFDEIVRSKYFSKYEDALFYLLCDYSIMKQSSRARECFSIIETVPIYKFSDFYCMALAQYYKLIGLNDSAIFYCKRILDERANIYNMYDAAKLSFNIFNRIGNIKEANQYARTYMQLSDSLDFGQRQELAATVNNEFQYHLDQKKEQMLKDEKEQYKNTLSIVVMTTILFACVSYIFYVGDATNI